MHVGNEALWVKQYVLSWLWHVSRCASILNNIFVLGVSVSMLHCHCFCCFEIFHYDQMITWPSWDESSILYRKSECPQEVKLILTELIKNKVNSLAVRTTSRIQRPSVGESSWVKIDFIQNNYDSRGLIIRSIMQHVCSTCTISVAVVH